MQQLNSKNIVIFTLKYLLETCNTIHFLYYVYAFSAYFLYDTISLYESIRTDNLQKKRSRRHLAFLERSRPTYIF